jgi:hypothetical protein
MIKLDRAYSWLYVASHPRPTGVVLLAPFGLFHIASDDLSLCCLLCETPCCLGREDMHMLARNALLIYCNLIKMQERNQIGRSVVADW